MLIDARHREETRVAVVKGNRIEEFDFESAEHKQLKGNIYLAKVTRVEPSLQAAFVDYGGNRHGFLAFSEIHPDYYQIPREDREALLAEEAEHAAEEAALREEEDDDYEGDDHDIHDEGVEEVVRPAHDDEDDDAPHAEGDAETSDGEQAEGRGRPRRGRGGKLDAAAEELRRKRMALRRRYKIQDVIKRRQVLLVQVVKEERGNKGAALTSYLSLAGRYCVLMPNTSHGGGISRKISNNADRKRLKSIIAEMALPSSMGCIVRTAGLSRTKPEIRRDFDYLARLWDEIREKTLSAVAPALIHNDSDLIKRAIRDIYNREIEEVIVEGEHGYRAAKDFMRLLMPSHVRKVRLYSDPVSLFQRFGVEDQLAAMYHPVVQLKSGGYLVINPTEALVSIDINSGRSTREHNIEQTAYATNIEAAREIARQLRLRDMAGLVVIDFIDMEHNSNIRKVEKAMKESLKEDRARIQVGRISGFGLMEMSRQRLRTGVLEASTRACPHCEGTGLVRTASSAGLSALRMLEEEAARGRGSLITLRASQEAAFYVLNNKRRELDEIEERYGVRIEILPDGEEEGARMSVEATGPRPERVVTYTQMLSDPEDDDLDYDEAEEEEEEEEAEAETEEASAESEPRGERAPAGQDRGDGNRKRKRRRRGRRGRRDDDQSVEGGEEAAEGTEDDVAEGEPVEALSIDADVDADLDEPVQAVGEVEADVEGEAPRKSRRGRRGGRRRRGGDAAGGETVEGGNGEGFAADLPDDLEPVTPVDADIEVPVEAVVEAPVVEAEAEPEPERKTRRRPRARKAEVAEPVAAPVEEAIAAPAVEAAPEEVEVKPKRRGRKPKAVEAEAQPETAAQPEAVIEAPADETPAPKVRRPRAKKVKADVEVAATPEADVAAPEPAPQPAATEPEAETPARPAADVGGDADGEEGPARRGWWQRTFGN
ncbi:MAG: Rne/Rng family ribonuclease [Sphingobium sp.]